MFLLFLYSFFIFLLGISIGSFLNVLIDRLPQEKSINGRSHCDFCKKTLKWYDLIPVISYIYLKAKCRYCKKKLSIQYPFIELLTGTIFFGVAYLMFDTNNLTLTGSISNILYFISILGICSSLIVIFFADVKYHIIPDSMQVSLLFFSVMLRIVQYSSTVGILKQVQDDIVAGILTMAPILLLFFITRGKGMGFGDVKLSFTIGFILGIVGGYVALYIAFIAGSIWGIMALILKKRGLKSKIAFGPFLIVGLVLYFIFKEQILLFLTNRIF